jgi:hypothetical protein
VGAMEWFVAIYQAGGKGFEPLQTDPESVVLPLDEPPIVHAGGILTCPRVSGKGRSIPGCAASIVLNIQQDQESFRNSLKNDQEHHPLQQLR